MEKTKVLCHQSYHLSCNWQAHSSCQPHWPPGCFSKLQAHSCPRAFSLAVPTAWNSSLGYLHQCFLISFKFSSEVPFLAWSSRSLSWKPQLAPSTTPAPLIYSPTAFYITFKHSVLLSFIHQVMSDSLWLHGLQHARVLCLPLSPGFCSNSCPLTQWCYLTISSSVIPFFCLQSFPDSASFLMSQIFASGCQSIRAAASASVLPMNIQGWLPLGLTGLIYLQSKGLSRVFSSTTIRKHPIPFSYFLSLNYYLSPLPPSTHINVNSTNISTFSCLSTVVFSAPSTELRM